MESYLLKGKSVALTEKGNHRKEFTYTFEAGKIQNCDNSTFQFANNVNVVIEIPDLVLNGPWKNLDDYQIARKALPMVYNKLRVFPVVKRIEIIKIADWGFDEGLGEMQIEDCIINVRCLAV